MVKAKIFKKYENHIKLFKARRIFNVWIDEVSKTKYFERKIDGFLQKKVVKLQKYALDKLVQRNQATKLLKLGIENLRNKRETKLKIDVLRQLRGDLSSKQLLCIKMSNLVHKYEICDKSKSFSLIKSFVRSRMASEWLQKGRAVRSLTQWIKVYQSKQLKSNFELLVQKSYFLHKQKSKLLKTLMSVHTKRVQTFFTTWKEHMSIKATIDDENEKALIRFGYRENEQDSQDLFQYPIVKNLVDFATTDCGLSHNEIYDVLSKGEDRIDMLQMNAVYKLHSHS